MGILGQKRAVITLGTGASHSIIRKDFALELHPFNTMKLTTVTGESTPILGTTLQSLSLGMMTTKHEFVVAEIVDEVILGLDFMLQYGFKIDLERCILKYQNTEILLQTESTTLANVKRIIVSEQTCIPPCSEAIIWGKLQEDELKNSLWIVESIEKNQINDIIVGKTYE